VYRHTRTVGAMADKSVNAKQGTAKSDAVLVADALLRASNRLAIAKKALSRIVGLSESSLSRLRKKDFELDGKSLELAILFIKMYRSLHAIVGGDDTAAAAWLKNMNATLGAAPLEMIQTISGLNDVISYLGSRRAQI
jgi:uncharacterized protein (DUF2384 family)